jgi:hypothetical protein
LYFIEGGEAHEDWPRFEIVLGNQQGQIDIDKSWNLLHVIFIECEVGDFILGDTQNQFYIDEGTICLLSNNYIKLVCEYVSSGNLLNKEVFINFCKEKDALSEKTNYDYYFSSFKKLIDFYDFHSKSENWVLGELM